MTRPAPPAAPWRHLLTATSYFILPLVVLPLAVLPAQALPNAKVVIVVIDGPRLSETFEEPGHPHIPGMWNVLRPAGATIAEFQNQGWTYTNPGNASVLTGTWQLIANDGSERPTRPTLFEYYRSATGAPITDAWLVTGKDKLDACAYSDYPGYGASFGASIDNLGRPDVETYDAFRAVLTSFHPTLSVLGLTQTDPIGHANDFTGYLRAIARADSLITDLWGWLESDPVYKQRTNLIVTNDHGRHLDSNGSFQHHGDNCLGCVRIGFLAIGPRFHPGSTSSFTRTQRDICPTVAEILGFSTNLSEGNVLDEILRAPLAVTEDLIARPAMARLAAFPNPFNPTIQIALDLEKAGVLRLDIEDVLGRRVRRLTSAYLPAGLHPFIWDGTDGAGRRLGSGVYYVVARSGRDIEAKRITLLR